MKKILVAMFLAVAMVAPAFAVMELDIKAGYIIEPTVTETGPNEYKCTYSQDPSYSVGADLYFYVLDNLGIGVGGSYIFDTDFDGKKWKGIVEDVKSGSTNIYAAVKPILAENGMVDKVYLLGQIGMGITKFSSDYKDYDFSENGLYWGAGLGIEKANIIVELLYSVNYWEHNDDSAWNEGWSYTTRRIAVNLGYRFGF
ncbi:outer membrane beta-barrel protein [Candidatus Ruminimicrobiellum ovillum]|uniref:outer membrane beta-barrel protein n=1 Tax=Candidatus Ruminimicrobiellum ovillum TaxID=1947927 RepID=UPI00355AA755